MATHSDSQIDLALGEIQKGGERTRLDLNRRPDQARLALEGNLPAEGKSA